MSQQSASLFARLAAGATMLLATITLAAVALHGWRMHALSLQAQHQALNTMADLGATQLSAALDTRPTDMPAMDALADEFDRWSWAVLRQPRMLLTMLGDNQGNVIRAVPQDVPYQGVVATLLTSDPAARSCKVSLAGERVETAWIVTRPVGSSLHAGPVATLLVAAERRPLIAAWVTWSVLFGVPLGGIAALSFVIALRWLHLRVREPLATLVRRGYEKPADWLARLPTHRADEVGLIARETGELVAQLNDLHAEVQSLRHTLDSRVALRTREINAQLRDAQQKTWIDPLTKLGNRRLLDERLNELFGIERQAGDDFTVVMFDVDNFKAHNDQMGHAAGDELLSFIGRLLRGSLRETDLPIRYAGDEFVILLPDTSQEHAVNLADRIVRLFAQQASLLKTRPHPTLSAGVASVRQCGAASARELLELADAALYQAKREGKNAVRAAARRRTQATTGQALSSRD